MGLRQRRMVIVNATSMDHLQILAEVVLAAIGRDRNFLFLYRRQLG